MNEYHIAVIPGDGIGQEVTPERGQGVGDGALETASEVLGGFRLSFETFP